MFVDYVTFCLQNQIAHVSWPVFSKYRKREHIGLLKFDKFLSEEVPLLESYKRQLAAFENQGFLNFKILNNNNL